MGSHAALSPSSASRWLACTPSARLEQGFENTTSKAAEEGTLAHELCELLLNYALQRLSFQYYRKRLSEIEHNEYYNVEMQQHCEDYRDLVLQNISENSHVFIEQKVDISEYVPEGSGTADTIVITEDLLDFYDYKYGKGIAVFAEKNKQLMLYGIGALYKFGFLFDIKRVRLNIVQPRKDSHTVYELTVDELVNWANTEVKPKAELAFKGKGDFVPGDHCKFCKAKPQCRALAEQNLEIAKDIFRSPDLLTEEETIQIVAKQKQFEDWIKSVGHYALAQAVNGRKYTGYKVVEGKSNRVFKNIETTELTLLAEGFKDIYEPKQVLGITALTQKLGKKTFAELVEPDLKKPSGKPTLAPESDSRPEFNTASVVFDDNYTETDI